MHMTMQVYKEGEKEEKLDRIFDYKTILEAFRQVDGESFSQSCLSKESNIW